MSGKPGSWWSISPGVGPSWPGSTCWLSPTSSEEVGDIIRGELDKGALDWMSRSSNSKHPSAGPGLTEAFTSSISRLDRPFGERCQLVRSCALADISVVVVARLTRLVSQPETSSGELASTLVVIGPSGSSSRLSEGGAVLVVSVSGCSEGEIT